MNSPAGQGINGFLAEGGGLPRQPAGRQPAAHQPAVRLNRASGSASDREGRAFPSRNAGRAVAAPVNRRAPPGNRSRYLWRRLECVCLSTTAVPVPNVVGGGTARPAAGRAPRALLPSMAIQPTWPAGLAGRRAARRSGHQPARDHPVQLGGVDGVQDPADRGLRWRPATQAEPGRDHWREVTGGGRRPRARFRTCLARSDYLGAVAARRTPRRAGTCAAGLGADQGS